MAPPLDCDIVIAGRGPVGMVLAHALAPLQESGLRMLQIGNAPPADDRPIALSWGSRLILEQLGLWAQLPCTPITTIHVSQQQAFGRTLISAADHGIEALGYVVSYRDLVQRLSTQSPVPVQDARITDWAAESEVIVQCGNEPGDKLRTNLLVLAEGGATPAEEKVKAYGQSAIVCSLQTEKLHDHRAWERFSPEGPLALLPFRDHYALVWTSRSRTAEDLMAKDDTGFLAAAQAAFGQRLGSFLKAGTRAAFPLSLRQRRETARRGVIAIGNSAQTLHPVAGQGLNLGLRDAWELAELVTRAVDASDPAGSAAGAAAGNILGSDEFARRYAMRRRNDRMALVGLTDGLVQAFGMNMPFASGMRGAALAFLDAVPPARRFLSRRMMFGARGLP